MESRIVQIETATDICSVALTNNGELLAYRESQIKNSHSNLITLFINEVLEEASVKSSGIDAIAVSGGPGSYTGIRIGMAVAKGIAFSLDKPLIKICTLQALAAAAKEEVTEGQNLEELLFVPLIDARRMEAFTAFYSYNDLKEVESPKAKIIDLAFFNEFLPSKKIVFVGNGTNKCKSFFEDNFQEIKNKQHYFLKNITCSAKWLSKLALRDFTNKNFVNLQTTTADYYKDFYTQTKLVKN